VIKILYLRVFYRKLIIILLKVKRMKKISRYAFLIIFGMILIWNRPIQSVNAQGEEDYTKEYDENLNLYILSNGDVIYHWDITDQGMYVDFPVSLLDPNSTTSAIEDVSVELNIYQASPKPQDMGIYASEYGGFFESDLPGNDWEYSFSHLTLEIDIDFDSDENLSLGLSWLNSLVSQLETTLNVDFLQYSNSTPGDGWNCEYRAFPQEYDAIWDLVLDPFPWGNTTLLAKEKFLESENKAIRIDANWDDENDEYRWEYTADIELYIDNLLSIGKDSNTIYFRDLLGYDGDFEMPHSVNESNLNIYLYKGAEISSVTPSHIDDVQDRGHIERELNFEGNMNGFLPESANFVFTDAKESQPILNSLFSVDDTTVNFGEEITVTGIITNVGGQTAYDIDVYYPSFSDFNLTSGESTYEIESLEPGESYPTSATYVCDDNSDDISNFQMYYSYDATGNLDLSNHWSQPQFSRARFRGSSNQIRIFQNDVDPEPWMVVEYFIDNIGPEVGEEINITATITNIGDVYASNIQWDFDPFPDGGDLGYSELGLNLTDDSGIIERLDPLESVNVSALYTVDAYNRYFGGDCGYSCDLTFNNQNESDQINMDSNDYYDNDAGSSVYLIYPLEGQIFGPVLLFNQDISAPTSETSTLLTIDFTISNNGSTPAYNVYVHSEYHYGSEYFYLQYLEGIGPDISIGTLYPGESLNYRTRFTLLKNTSIANLSVTPYITYSVRQDSETCFLTPNQISEGSKKLSGETIWMIVAIAAISVIIGESFVFYKKVKM
jgi:hypothetical protein